MYKTTDLVN